MHFLSRKPAMRRSSQKLHFAIGRPGRIRGKILRDRATSARPCVYAKWSRTICEGLENSFQRERQRGVEVPLSRRGRGVLGDSVRSEERQALHQACGQFREIGEEQAR